MMLVATMVMLMQSAVPPCPQGKSECDPWERYNPQPNYFDQFDPKPPKHPKLGPGPHTLVIIGSQVPVRVDYKSGSACEKARDAFVAQFVAQHPGIVVSGVTAACIPH